ncbi:MAG: DJ-1/PfpI family protein [Coriobacteriia bacterium]
MAHVLMVIAPDQFRDEEYAHPKEVLESRGGAITTASVAAGPCRGKLGMLARATVAIADCTASDYDAVVFVGGGGASVFFDDPAAHRLAREALDLGRVVTAICIAPSALARAGVLTGRRATAFASQEADLRAHGAIWTGVPVEIDGAIITANGPAAARDFGMAIADSLGLP